ncbi:C-type lectin domain family 4 member F-like [Macrobrachium nipponense]|uniref:C-type lectin domain family 4 member F-like n=1 Tax=Macrobrachium nipponense TaxID=159736 RepID=UPI0030C85033
MKAFWCLFALGIFLHIHEGQAMCPQGFVPFYIGEMMMETCLKFAMDMKREWHTAESYCKSISADLAQLDDEDIHWQVITYIRQHPHWLHEGFHIGCTDEDIEDVWVWTDGRKVDMFSGHWYPGQPDGGLKENYGCLYYDDFLYSSCVNGHKLYTICRQ